MFTIVLCNDTISVEAFFVSDITALGSNRPLAGASLPAAATTNYVCAAIPSCHCLQAADLRSETPRHPLCEILAQVILSERLSIFHLSLHLHENHNFRLITLIYVSMHVAPSISTNISFFSDSLSQSTYVRHAGNILPCNEPLSTQLSLNEDFQAEALSSGMLSPLHGHLLVSGGLCSCAFR